MLMVCHGQVPTEIHTIETRSAGQSVTVFFNFLASFSIAQAFLSIICKLQVRALPTISSFCSARLALLHACTHIGDACTIIPAHYALLPLRT